MTHDCIERASTSGGQGSKDQPGETEREEDYVQEDDDLEGDDDEDFCERFFASSLPRLYLTIII